MVDDAQVVFPDANLEAAVRQELGKPEGTLSSRDLEALKRLRTFTEGRPLLVENITKDLLGLEHAVNLTELMIVEGQISDLSPISSLTNLTIFGVIIHFGLTEFRNQVSNLSPLSSLTNLTLIGLSGSQISDISPLASLTNLTHLFLGDNQISDISPLSSLTNLAQLALSDNQIVDIGPLASLTNLIELQVSDNRISDISPLALLPKLDYLELARNPLNREAIDVFAPLLSSRGVGVNL